MNAAQFEGGSTCGQCIQASLPCGVSVKSRLLIPSVSPSACSKSLLQRLPMSASDLQQREVLIRPYSLQIQGTGNGAGANPVSTAPFIATITNVCSECNYGDIDLQVMPCRGQHSRHQPCSFAPAHFSKAAAYYGQKKQQHQIAWRAMEQAMPRQPPL